MELDQILIRLGAATLVGLLLGLDRELRGFPAGLRTHGLVALSSAAITVSALKLQQELAPSGVDADPLRVIQGLAQAIGFIAAGVIFASRGTVHNVTTATNLWLASALGIAAGAAHFDVMLAAFGFGITLLVLVGFIEKRLLSRKRPVDRGGRPPPPL
jgi:putative Mg2+ transporter-C (MgtC) family protein